MKQTSEFYSRLLESCDKNLVEINTVLNLLYQELQLICRTLLYLDSVQEQYPARIDHFLQSFGVNLPTSDKFLFPFLINNIPDVIECNFFIEEFIREKKFERGLFDQELNEVLCRDFLRRTFILWKFSFPPHLLDSFQNLLFSIEGGNQSIKVRELEGSDF